MTRHRVTGHYPGLVTTTSPSDSSQRIGSLFVIDLWLPYPCRACPTVSTSDLLVAVSRQLLGTSTRSPQVTRTTLSSHPRPNHLHRPPATDAAVSLQLLTTGVLGFACSMPPRRRCRPCTGSLHVRGCNFASAPFRPRLATTPWASATQRKRPNAEEGLSPSSRCF